MSTKEFTPAEWNKVKGQFQFLKPVPITPLNTVQLGQRTPYDDLFLGARTALAYRLKDQGHHDPLLLAKAGAGRMPVALQQAQYMIENEE